MFNLRRPVSLHQSVVRTPQVHQAEGSLSRKGQLRPPDKASGAPYSTFRRNAAPFQHLFADYPQYLCHYNCLAHPRPSLHQRILKPVEICQRSHPDLVLAYDGGYQRDISLYADRPLCKF